MNTGPISTNNSSNDLMRSPSGDDIKKPVKRESVNSDPLAIFNSPNNSNLSNISPPPPPPSSIEQSYVSIVRTPPVDPLKKIIDSFVSRCR
jgi:hypothetical protein